MELLNQEERKRANNMKDSGHDNHCSLYQKWKSVCVVKRKKTQSYKIGVFK